MNNPVMNVRANTRAAQQAEQIEMNPGYLIRERSWGVDANVCDGSNELRLLPSR